MIGYHVGSIAQLHLAGDVHYPWSYLQSQKRVVRANVHRKQLARAQEPYIIFLH